MYEFLERARWASGALGALVVASAVGFVALLLGTFRLPWEATVVALLALAAVLVLAFVYGDRGVLRRLAPRVSEHPLRAKARAALAEAALCLGVPEPPIMLLDLAAVNAGVVGHSKDRRVLVTTTATVRALEPNELRAVFAHELAHLRAGDTAAATLTWILASVGRGLAVVGVPVLLEVAILWGLRYEGTEFLIEAIGPVSILTAMGVAVFMAVQTVRGFEEDEIRMLPRAGKIGRGALVALAPFLLLALHGFSGVLAAARSDTFARLGGPLVEASLLCFVAGLAARLGQAAFMRSREYVADATAALATREPVALAWALVAMSSRSTGIPSSTRASAHLYTMPPQVLAHEPLIKTHPSVPERLKRLRDANPADSDLAALVADYLAGRPMYFHAEPD